MNRVTRGNWHRSASLRMEPPLCARVSVCRDAVHAAPSWVIWARATRNRVVGARLCGVTKPPHVHCRSAMVCCGRVRLGSLSGCRCGRVGPLGTSGCGQLPVPRRAGAEGGVGGSLPGVRVSQPGSTRRRQGVAGERPVASGVAWRVNASGRAGICSFNKAVTPGLGIRAFQSITCARFPRAYQRKLVRCR